MSKAEPNISAEFYREGDRDYVRISIKGCSDTLIRRVTAADIARFAEEWEILRQGLDEAAPAGMPLDQVPGLSPSRITTLKLNGIQTAEQLVAVDDAVIMNLGMGMRTAQRAARSMIDSRSEIAEAARPTAQRVTTDVDGRHRATRGRKGGKK